MTKLALPDVLSYANDEAERQGVDPSLAKAIVIAENFGDQSVGKVFAQPDKFNVDTERTSPRGARGIMQVMPATYESLKSKGFLPADHTLDTWQGHVQAGVAAIKEIQKRLGTTDYSAIAADYNAGPRGSKALATGGTLPAETVNYLSKVNTATGIDAGKAAPSTTPLSPTSGSADEANSGLLPPSGDTKSVGGAGTSPKTTTSSVLNFSGIEKLVRDNGLILQTFIKDLTSSREEEAKAHKEAATSIQLAGEAASLVETKRAIIEAASQQSREKILALTNLDPSAIDGLVATTLNDFRARDTKRKVLADEIDQRMSVGFFDNPLQWLVNQTVLPGKVNAHNALARRQNEGLQVLDTLNTAAKNLEAIDVVASADQIASLHVAMGNEKVATANANASLQKAQAASATARAAAGIAQLTNTQIGQELELARMRKIVETDRLGGRTQQQVEEDNEFERQLKIIGTAIGSGDVSLASLRRDTKPNQDLWASAVARKAAGTDMGHALSFIKKFGNFQTLAGTGSAEFAVMARDLDTEVSRLARIAAQQPPDLSGRKPTVEQLYQQSADELYGKYWKEKVDMLLASPANPYKINHFSVATGWNGDPNNDVWKYVRTAYTNKIKVTDAQLFTAVTQQVAAGKMNPTQAAQQVADYYSTAVALNNKGKSFTFVGMEAQSDYMILPKESNLAINLTNPADIENFFVRKAATAAADKARYDLLLLHPSAREQVEAAKKKRQEAQPVVTAGSNP